MSDCIGRKWSLPPGRIGLGRAFLLAAALGTSWPGSASAQSIVHPDGNADGTLVDGGVYGPFDGVPDDWDWTFNESGYEGTISRTVTPPDTGLEHRVFFEFNLNYVPEEPPVTATLTFAMRGAYTYPFPDSEVHIYAYPADGWASLPDYSMGPAVWQGSVTILPYQPPTVYTIGVSQVVNDALSGSDARAAFRFQIDPDTTSVTAQAFIDALDEDVETKPYLTISNAVPGDTDGDGDVDLIDFALFASCMSGPEVAVEPACDAGDLDLDGDIDLRDLRSFEQYFSGSP